jgi:hypothetical protein
MTGSRREEATENGMDISSNELLAEELFAVLTIH